jgi:predicted enzyme related to lactoylglutathione lyase
MAKAKKKKKSVPAKKKPRAPKANPQGNVGRIGWIDLTVKDATRVKDFYAQVIGWKVAPLDCGGYEDFCMNVPVDNSTIAGICHAVGANAALPPAWLVYVNVESVPASLEKVLALGGSVIDGPRKLGGRDFACIRDPAGAYLALIEADKE